MKRNRISALWAAAGFYIGTTSEPWMTAIRHVINIMTSDISLP